MTCLPKVMKVIQSPASTVYSNTSVKSLVMSFLVDCNQHLSSHLDTWNGDPGTSTALALLHEAGPFSPYRTKGLRASIRQLILDIGQANEGQSGMPNNKDEKPLHHDISD